MSAPPSPPPPPLADAARSLLVAGPGERARQLRSRFFSLLCTLSAVVVLVPLFSIFLYVVRRGLTSLNLS